LSLFDSPKTENRIWLALRLGWTVAEFYGRLRQGNLLWRSTSTSFHIPRLFLSDLNPTSGEKFWVIQQRLAFLSRQLFPASDDDASYSYSVLDIAKYPKIDALLKMTGQRVLSGKGKLPSIASVYDELNQWSRQIWATLDAEDPTLADAATLGARLADTFWQLQFSNQRQIVNQKQTWQHLLKPQRMIATIRLVRRVEIHLPSYVGSILRYCLWEWGIAEELTVSSSGCLEIASSKLYWFRNLGWIRKIRLWQKKMWVKKQPKSCLLLDECEKKDLQKQLQNQIDIWERLIFNRSPVYLINPTDWQQIRWLSFIIYAATALLIMFGGAFLIAGLTILSKQFLEYVLPLLAQPTEFADQLTLVSTSIAVIAFLLTQFRRALNQLRHLYDSIYNWVTLRKLEQRCLCSWNGKTKSLFWVWLQRLSRAED
jgi:hypothetical protein